MKQRSYPQLTLGPTLITGGAGFIGTNMADRLLSAGGDVIILDNLSRAGVERNLRWLLNQHGSRVRFIPGDVRNTSDVETAVRDAKRVFHFAAQVAVTTSLIEPVEDFEINARGTLNVLEAIRKRGERIPLLFTSTNKVYGDLRGLELMDEGQRYTPPLSSPYRAGVNEERPTEFHSPYGCSKGAADQYVLDYSRTFSMPAVVFRMSCIYGPHQFGTEDQGWVAHFLIRAMQGKPITLYGDGKQVRDILFVDDLMEAMLLAQTNIDELTGQAFNIGGGTGNTTSLLELMDLIGELHPTVPEVEFADWRAADQRFYVSDINRFARATRWTPRVGVKEGVSKLYQWLAERREPKAPARTKLKNARRKSSVTTSAKERATA